MSIDGLTHDDSEDHVCSVCSCEFTDDEGGITGYFGILPVSFCPYCFSSMCDMADQYNEIEPMSDEKIADLWSDTNSVRNFARALEKEYGIGCE